MYMIIINNIEKKTDNDENIVPNWDSYFYQNFYKHV